MLLFFYGFASIFPENIKKQHESHAVSISEQFQIFFYKACSTCLWFQIMGSEFEGGFTARGTYLLKKIPFVELDFNDKIQKELYESVLVSVKRIRELNNVLEQRKDKASVSVIEAEKENLSKRIEDDITKIYNLKF